VVDDGDLPGRHAVMADHLVLHAVGDGDDLLRRVGSEALLLQRELEALLRTDLAPQAAEERIRRVGPDQVLAMGPSAEAEDVLERRAAVGMDDVERLLLEELARLRVEALMAEEPFGRHGMGEVAPALGDRASKDVDLVVSRDQEAGEVDALTLGAACRGELLDDERDLHFSRSSHALRTWPT